MNSFINSFVNILSTVSQIIGIVVVSIGMIKAFIIYFKRTIAKKNAVKTINMSRLELGHSFSLGLGFLIGASIIKTTIAPTWNDIGELGAIVAIRTVLNFFLTRDIQQLSLNNKQER